MSFAAANIRRAVRNIMEGASGSVRTLEAGVYRSGLYAEMPEGAQRAQARAARRGRLEALLNGTVFRPLVDTGRGARMAPHITGGKGHRPPSRNFSVFRRVGGNWALMPQLHDYVKARLTRALGTPTGAP